MTTGCIDDHILYIIIESCNACNQDLVANLVFDPAGSRNTLFELHQLAFQLFECLLLVVQLVLKITIVARDLTRGAFVLVRLPIELSLPIVLLFVDLVLVCS